MSYHQSEQLTIMEPCIDQEPVGTFGMRWIKFMESNHPKLVKQMKSQHIFLTVARSVDERAWDYLELLESQYAELHPRPTGFENTVSWEYTRAFYTDGTVMREVVLVPVTKP